MGSPRSEYHFMGFCNIEVLLDFLSSLLVSIGSFLGKCMYTPVNIAVIVGVVVGDGVNDLLRLLSGGSIIEIDEILAVDLPLQNRKIGSDGFDV